jgi:aerobic C4-dicarboxylate transport protein
MGFLKALAQSPLALLLCLLAGVVAGVVVPSLAESAFVLGQVYLALINMVAIPLMVVATIFGLRQTMALPLPARRSAMIVVLGFGLVFLAASIGTGLGYLAGPGQHMDADSRAYLGAVVLSADGAAGNAEISLFGVDAEDALPAPRLWAILLPDNFFRALAQGQTLGILSCAILFGLAFAAMGKTRSNMLMNVFEAIYRTFEVIIYRVNLFIPVLAFGMAAHFAANVDGQILRSMGSFVAVFVAASLALATVSIVLVWRSVGTSLGMVLSSLKTPILISLTSASSTASVPDTIRAMSAKLGYSRGIVELVVPAASIFVRAGSAVYFALLAVFVANIYGHALNGTELVLICVGAAMSAFASAGASSFAIVGSGSVVLSLLNLPVEAALALFLAIDLICEAPRNLLSTLCCCVLIVLVCRGLPSERMDARLVDVPGPAAPIQLKFTRESAFVALLCSAVLAALIVLAGIGVGQKVNRIDLLGPAPIHSGELLVDNPANTK